MINWINSLFHRKTKAELIREVLITLAQNQNLAKTFADYSQSIDGNAITDDDMRKAKRREYQRQYRLRKKGAAK